MRTKNLGTLGATSAIGLGLLGMSGGAYGATDRAESITTIHAAVDAGITLLDTGDFYGMGHNEMLLADALEKNGSQRRSDQRQIRQPARPRRRLPRRRRAPEHGENITRILPAATTH
jgi:predicted oxidoreductase